MKKFLFSVLIVLMISGSSVLFLPLKSDSGMVSFGLAAGADRKAKEALEKIHKLERRVKYLEETVNKLRVTIGERGE